jgi:hypothetical protein
MSETKPDADELRIRGMLRRMGVGANTAPQPPAAPTQLPPGYPPARPTDWLDDILNGDPTSGPPKPAPGPPKKTKPKRTSNKKRKRSKTSAPATPFDRQPSAPRQSLADAWGNVPPRLRWLIYHAAAAAAGWRLGWVDWGTDTAAWYAAGHWVSPSALVLYGLGVVALALYRRSRRWAWPVAWAAAIPVSSVVVGVLLYGTGYQP